MRKLATICLIFLFCSVYTELGQLWKLPLLIQHYYIHQQQEDASLGHFLLEHYGSQHDDADKEDDMKLPFKATLDSPAANALPAIIKTVITKPEIIESSKFVPLYTSFIPLLFVRQIFHPPCIV